MAVITPGTTTFNAAATPLNLAITLAEALGIELTDNTAAEVADRLVAALELGATAAADLRTLLDVEEGATGDQTGAEIKTAYEAEADTNAFTDAYKDILDELDDTVVAPNNTIQGYQADAVAFFTAADIRTFLKVNDPQLVTSASAALDLALAHDEKYLRLTHATPVLTIRPNASIAYVAEHTTMLVGVNAFTVTGDTGVSINGSSASSWTVDASPGGCVLMRTASDTWDLVGAAAIV